MANHMLTSSSSSSSLMLSNGPTGEVAQFKVPSGFIFVSERCMLILDEVTGELVEHMVPSGYQFKPRDWDLILYYVEKKNKGLPNHISFPEHALYDKCIHEVPAYFKYAEGNKKYFFTEKKYRGLKRLRSAPDGTWEEHKNIKIIFEGKLIGHKRIFYFTYKGNIQSNLGMLEFSSAEEKDKFVLCVIYEKDGVTETKNTSTWEANEEVRRQQSQPPYLHQFECTESSQATSMSGFPDKERLDAAPAMVEPSPHQSNYVFGPQISENGTPWPLFTDMGTREYDNGGVMSLVDSNHMNYPRQFGNFDTANSQNIGSSESMVTTHLSLPITPTCDPSFISANSVSGDMNYRQSESYCNGVRPNSTNISSLESMVIAQVVSRAMPTGEYEPILPPITATYFPQVSTEQSQFQLNNLYQYSATQQSLPEVSDISMSNICGTMKE